MLGVNVAASRTLRGRSRRQVHGATGRAELMLWRLLLRLRRWLLLRLLRLRRGGGGAAVLSVAHVPIVIEVAVVVTRASSIVRAGIRRRPGPRSRTRRSRPCHRCRPASVRAVKIIDGHRVYANAPPRLSRLALNQPDEPLGRLQHPRTAQIMEATQGKRVRYKLHRERVGTRACACVAGVGCGETYFPGTIWGKTSVR